MRHFSNVLPSLAIIFLTLSQSLVNLQLLNSLQLGLKNLLNNVIPDVDMALPVEVHNLQIPSIGIPNGNNQVVPLGCPVCQTINPYDLTGVWYQIYANDNFIRNHLLRMAAVSESASASADQAVGSGGSNNAGHRMSMGMKLMAPARMPVCVRVDVGEPINYGFTMDFPTLITFHEGVPRGKVMQVVGRLRPAAQDSGVFILMVGTGAAQYRVKLCISSSSLPRNAAGTGPQPQTSLGRQNQQIFQNLPSNLKIPRFKRSPNVQQPINAGSEFVINDQLNQNTTIYTSYSEYLSARIDEQEERNRLSGKVDQNDPRQAAIGPNIRQSFGPANYSNSYNIQPENQFVEGNKPVVQNILLEKSSNIYEKYSNHQKPKISNSNGDDSEQGISNSRQIFNIYDSGSHSNKTLEEIINGPRNEVFNTEDQNFSKNGQIQSQYSNFFESKSLSETTDFPQFAKFPNQNIVPVEYLNNNIPADEQNTKSSTLFAPNSVPTFAPIITPAITAPTLNQSVTTNLKIAPNSTKPNISYPNENSRGSFTIPAQHATINSAPTPTDATEPVNPPQSTTEYPELSKQTIPIVTQFPPPPPLNPQNLFPVFPSSHESGPAKSGGAFPLDQPSRYIIFAEMSGFPSCQNHLVLSTDRGDFFRRWDADVLQTLRNYRANTDMNPVLYTGCPQGME